MEDDIDFESDDESLPPWEESEYNDLMTKLRRNEPDTDIKINREVLDFILAEKIDEFCRALRLASSLKRIDIGDRLFEEDEVPLPTLEFHTREFCSAQQAWGGDSLYWKPS